MRNEIMAIAQILQMWPKMKQILTYSSGKDVFDCMKCQICAHGVQLGSRADISSSNILLHNSSILLLHVMIMW